MSFSASGIFGPYVLAAALGPPALQIHRREPVPLQAQQVQRAARQHGRQCLTEKRGPDPRIWSVPVLGLLGCPVAMGKKSTLCCLVDFRGTPFPKKGRKGTTGQLGQGKTNTLGCPQTIQAHCHRERAKVHHVDCRAGPLAATRVNASGSKWSIARNNIVEAAALQFGKLPFVRQMSQQHCTSFQHTNCNTLCGEKGSAFIPCKARNTAFIAESG